MASYQRTYTQIDLVSEQDMPIASVLNKAGLVKNAAMARSARLWRGAC